MTEIDHTEDAMLLLGRVDANVKTLLARADSHETRLVSVEKAVVTQQWKTHGLIAAIGTALGWDHIKNLLPFMS